MKKILYYIPSVIFNLSELLIIYLFGRWLTIPMEQIVVIFGVFVVTRMFFKQTMHYKDWYRCMIWSTLVFISFFLVVKVNLFLGIIMTIFAGFILTQKGNIDTIQIES